jgi:hypothetical protein
MNAAYIENPGAVEYTTGHKLPKHNGPVSVLTATSSASAAKVARLAFPDYTKADHEAAAVLHRKLAEGHDASWSSSRHLAHLEAFGCAPSVTDYRISGIGRDEYSDAWKAKLRTHAHTASAHRACAAAHFGAAKLRNLAR